MTYATQTGYMRCPKIGRQVPIKSSEGRCRDINNCDDGRCPLEQDFGNDRFGRAVERLASIYAPRLSPLGRR